MKFTQIFLAVKQATGSHVNPYPWGAIMAGTYGKLQFWSMKSVKANKQEN